MNAKAAAIRGSFTAKAAQILDKTRAARHPWPPPQEGYEGSAASPPQTATSLGLIQHLRSYVKKSMRKPWQ